ncbi:MAG: hypothetical protein C0469_01925 [Cyanobacteria bacterium DS2.3.42]|nr:hypothetical protein [Cyanobacteria bacterium DS2.3.42]
MSNTPFVRRHVNRLKERHIFESEDVLGYGARSSVDTVLKELVRKGQIVRLARGIYMRGDDNTPRPTPEELAAFRAESLGCSLVCMQSDGSRASKSFNADQNSKRLEFFVNGKGSSFRYGEFKIVLKPISRKNLRKSKRQ